MLKFLWFLGLILAPLIQADSAVKLRGVTIQTLPFAIQHKNLTFSGFAVDLISQIAQKASFDYELYLTPDGAYGVEVDGKMNGMIGQVAEKKADFALADLTMTDTRQKYVDFTEPFLNSTIYAIVQRQFAPNATTLEDLLQIKDMKFVTLASGAVYRELSRSNQPLGIAIRQNIDANLPKTIVRSTIEGLDRVYSFGRYAFLTTSTYAQFYTALNCNLLALPDNQNLILWNYGIALQKNSPHLAAFNTAIRALKVDGSIEELKQQYWGRKCNETTTAV